MNHFDQYNYVNKRDVNFRKMRSTLEKRLEKSAKSLEEQRREKQRKLARSSFNLTGAEIQEKVPN